jgi:hypothetical protein
MQIKTWRDNMKKKIAALLLTAVMSFGVFGVCAYASVLPPAEVEFNGGFVGIAPAFWLGPVIVRRP